MNTKKVRENQITFFKKKNASSCQKENAEILRINQARTKSYYIKKLHKNS